MVTEIFADGIAFGVKDVTNAIAGVGHCCDAAARIARSRPVAAWAFLTDRCHWAGSAAERRHCE
jgi:hypothetical protein